MNVKVIYHGIDTTLLDAMEFYGLDWVNFLKMLVISCNQKMYSINLVESWLKHHDSFYHHPELISVMRQIAQYISFTVRPWAVAKPVLRCELVKLDVNEMVIIYECSE